METLTYLPLAKLTLDFLYDNFYFFCPNFFLKKIIYFPKPIFEVV
ncbi:unknown protein [Simkania negevensis Z]|uniref:Uncharacterized protein n=1 Tax=Simkania negevensis (strain ATCC VR-1471 / DSM 27360 / Z) TaxID=331113 RepID=F8L7J3_SIMNZ|nr:unknown protein [Simkania negevensis Z]